MLQSTERDPLELLSELNIKPAANDTFTIEGDEQFRIEPALCKELVQLFTKNPSILKSQARLKHKPSKLFSLCAWFIGFTDISHKLAAGIFNNTVISEGNLRDYAYICNFMKKYEPQALAAVHDQLFHFYSHQINSELKPLFIELLMNFIPEMDEEWKEVLNLNWREGRRDLAMASLQTLLKSQPPADFFHDFDKFERIDNLKVLAQVLLTVPPNSPNSLPIFQLFRGRICTSIDNSNTSKHRIKIAKLDTAASSDWTEEWTRVIQNHKIWPSASDDIHPIDLLSKLAFSGINPDKTTFKTFFNAFNSADEDVCVTFLSELIPGALNQCTWLHECLPRPLLQLFSQLLKTSTAATSQEVLLALCRLFMDSFLGTLARKCFVNYLAAHAQDDLIGEQCLGLIKSFIEKFPESRYVCLVLIKSLLEGVDTWQPRLLDPFYSSFALMARSSDSVMNDLILLLKKQIYSSDVVYKRIGARGVGVFLATNGLADRIKAHEEALLPDPDDTFNDIASCSQKPRADTAVKSNYHLRIIISLLEESVKSLRSDRQAMLIFFKYVEACFDDLDEELKDWIGDWTRSVFQSSFITQIDEESHSYKYEQDEDNPLALNFSGDLKDCAPVMLSILGKSEAGNLEGIDALQGCAIRTDQNASLAADFHLKFVVLNYFRTVLNTFAASDSRIPIVVELQKELKNLLKTKAAFLSEFKLFPEGHALLQLNNCDLITDLEVTEGSFLDALLKETRASDCVKLKGPAQKEDQLCELNEGNFLKSLVPLQISVIQQLCSGSLDANVSEFLLKEIDCLIDKNNVNEQRKLLDCLLKLSPGEMSAEMIEIVCKCKKEAISASQRATLLKASKEILKTPEKASLLPAVCKLLIDVLGCPDQISDPMTLIRSSLTTQNSALKHLLTLPSVDITSLFVDFKSTQVPLKNRLVLLKGFGSRLSKQMKRSSIDEAQKILAFWAELIQNVRGEGNLRLLQGIVKESHVVLECFLTGDAIKWIESEALLLEGSGNRESVLLLLKTVQQSTRGLQIICNHLKYSEKGSKSVIINDPLAIPNLKKSLEAVIFRVKDILTRSGCLNAFWMGNLKHRDLEGQELSSQVELLQLRDSEDLSEEFITEDSETEESEESEDSEDAEISRSLNDLLDDSAEDDMF